MAVTKRARSPADAQERPPKVPRPSFGHLFSLKPHELSRSAILPGRRHDASYHRPRLLDSPQGISSLLEWFQGVSQERDMPWRQTWISPDEHDATERLKTRAYQVWISEIMLQQTRVETVKSYWINWMKKWPSIDDLAAAEPEQVLSAWRGLGYYSRATRIHTAAKKVVQDQALNGHLPQLPQDLESQVPGVGRYTAGAISSIVFGHAVPILDGNVIRVLTRQMALYANPKSKSTTDMLWAAADALVKKASMPDDDVSSGSLAPIPRSKTPGQWNQALMELGSTVCTPKPACQQCPIRSTCMAYAEGELLAKASPSKFREPAIQDIENVCSSCEDIEPALLESQYTSTGQPLKPNEKQSSRQLRQTTLNFGGASTRKPFDEQDDRTEESEAIARHVRLFPLKVAKKQVREEECIVCIIQRSAGPRTDSALEYLIEQRPDNGLLASMWQFPSLTTVVEDSEERQIFYKDTSDRSLAERFGSQLVGKVKYSHKLGSVAHVFSHLKLNMHVHVVKLVGSAKELEDCQGKSCLTVRNKNFGSSMEQSARRRWATAKAIEDESMGTGMRNCWALLSTKEKKS